MINKVALVTGASSGIGESIALALADAGYFIMAAGRNAARTEQLSQRSANIQARIGRLDSSKSCSELITACVDRFGRLDLLVNNAGIYCPADAENTSDETWLDTIAINLNAPFFLSRAALPYLRQTRGVILNIASDWGLVGGRNAVAYCASKGGVVLMTKAMALDHSREGIRINAICPGDVETPMLYESGAARDLDQDAALREADAASPTGRVTKPDEVAALAVFLASEAAAQITGAAIPIDGGNSA